MEQDNSDLLPHYYPFWNRWWYIIECLLEKQINRELYDAPLQFFQWQNWLSDILSLLSSLLIIIQFAPYILTHAARKKHFWLTEYRDLKRGHLVSSFIDTLMRDAGVASASELSACMDNRVDWAATQLARLRPPEWMTIMKDEIWFCSQCTWRTGNITAGKIIPKIIIIITVTWR